MGGLKKNKHRDRKLRSGRGTIGKTPLARVRDRLTQSVPVMVVPNNRKATLQAFVCAHLELGTRLYTDEAAAYRNFAGYRHASINHVQGEYGCSAGFLGECSEDCGGSQRVVWRRPPSLAAYGFPVPAVKSGNQSGSTLALCVTKEGRECLRLLPSRWR